VRSWFVVTPAENGGEECQEPLETTQENVENGIYYPDAECRTDACCAGDWTQWSDCDVTCDTGTVYRDFIIDESAADNADLDCSQETQSKTCLYVKNDYYYASQILSLDGASDSTLTTTDLRQSCEQVSDYLDNDYVLTDDIKNDVCYRYMAQIAAWTIGDDDCYGRTDKAECVHIVYEPNYKCGDDTNLSMSFVDDTDSERHMVVLNFCIEYRYELKCPIDCVGNWSNWTSVREDYKWRTFQITTSAENNGTQCECECGTDVDIEDENCYIDQDCTTDCDEIPENPDQPRQNYTPCVESYQYVLPCIGQWTPWSTECSLPVITVLRIERSRLFKMLPTVVVGVITPMVKQRIKPAMWILIIHALILQAN
jgi:hypothetical protein